VHRLAVGNRDGELEFGYSGSDAMMHLRRPGEQQHEAHQKVRCTRLDSFEPYRSYAIGKMDIEGAEPMALEGAIRRLRKGNPPVWLLELAGYSNCYGVPSHEVVRQLAEVGFQCAVFNPQSRRLEYTRTPWTLGVQNILAVATTHRDAVEGRLRKALAP
jgi:hypothetical protein